MANFIYDMTLDEGEEIAGESVKVNAHTKDKEEIYRRPRRKGDAFK